MHAIHAPLLSSPSSQHIPIVPHIACSYAMLLLHNITHGHSICTQLIHTHGGTHIFETSCPFPSPSTFFFSFFKTTSLWTSSTQREKAISRIRVPHIDWTNCNSSSPGICLTIGWWITLIILSFYFFFLRIENDCCVFYTRRQEDWVRDTDARFVLEDFCEYRVLTYSSNSCY